VRALAYAHRRGVVHRDIKPDNILLSEDSALVADFGIARAVTRANPGRDEERDEERDASADPGSHAAASTLTQAGISLGTPGYMAPEQALGDPTVDHRADLYALGVVAYEMLVGRHLFGERTPQQMMAAHAVEPPPPWPRARLTRRPRWPPS
jgi:serine/threonine-protein kinase